MWSCIPLYFWRLHPMHTLKQWLKASWDSWRGKNVTVRVTVWMIVPRVFIGFFFKSHLIADFWMFLKRVRIHVSVCVHVWSPNMNIIDWLAMFFSSNTHRDLYFSDLGREYSYIHSITVICHYFAIHHFHWFLRFVVSLTIKVYMACSSWAVIDFPPGEMMDLAFRHFHPTRAEYLPPVKRNSSSSNLKLPTESMLKSVSIVVTFMLDMLDYIMIQATPKVIEDGFLYWSRCR